MFRAAPRWHSSAQAVAADEFEKLGGLFLAPAALLDEILDAGFHDKRDAAIGKTLG
jgi:hypothetical protein